MSTSAQLAQLSGAAEILTDSAALAAYEVDELRPAAAAIPNSAAEVGEVIRLAAAEKLAIIPSAGRTKLSIGAPPARYDVALDLSRMNRALAYDPRDLTSASNPESHSRSFRKFSPRKINFFRWHRRTPNGQPSAAFSLQMSPAHSASFTAARAILFSEWNL